MSRVSCPARYVTYFRRWTGARVEPWNVPELIRRPLGTSKELLSLLERAPRLNIAFDEAFRTLATDVVALQEENRALRETAEATLREMALLRLQLATRR